MVDDNTNSDLGFGSKLAESGERLIHKDGSFNIIRKGKKIWNTYQVLINMPSGEFAIICLLFFLSINAIFAILFLIVGIEQLNGVPNGNLFHDFLYAFFFSIQTFTTVGYGGINPVGISANFISSLCASVGLISFALITGLFFARFSRPRSHITFSKKALITPYKEITSFQARVVNRRDHKIIDISAQLVMTWLEKKGGKFNRRYATLPLERRKVFLFPLNWTIVHPITSSSPLFGKTIQELLDSRAEFLLSLSGFDESYNQIIHANTSYICEEVMTGVKFKPMYSSSKDGPTILNLDLLNEVLPI